MSRRKRNQIDGQFNARLIEMMESPAHRILSRAGRLVLDRISIELAHHGGNDNGKLPVTYDQFVDYGVDRQAVAPAIRELVALGFVEVTERGRYSSGEIRPPNLFRLTWINSMSSREPTHEWRRIKTMDEARAVAQAARAAKDEGAVQRSKAVVRKTKSHGGETHPVPGWKTHHEKACSPGWEIHPTGPGWEIHPPSISRGETAHQEAAHGGIATATVIELRPTGQAAARRAPDA